MELWRLCKSKYAATALSGEGARLYSGRWNPSGVSLVYLSASKALATLEWLVNLDQSLAPTDLVTVSVTIPEVVTVERVEVEALPPDWRTPDHPRLQAMGAAWISSGRGVALQVPSAVVEGEWNVLLNPAHPDFAKLIVGKPVPYALDQRLVERPSKRKAAS